MLLRRMSKKNQACFRKRVTTRGSVLAGRRMVVKCLASSSWTVRWFLVPLSGRNRYCKWREWFDKCIDKVGQGNVGYKMVPGPHQIKDMSWDLMSTLDKLNIWLFCLIKKNLNVTPFSYKYGYHKVKKKKTYSYLFICMVYYMNKHMQTF